MKKTVSIALATLVVSVIGCASSGPVSMRGSNVDSADRAPDTKTYTVKQAGVGQEQLIARTFVGQPPMVPHTTEKYEPLKAEDNACIECHISDELRGKKMPKMGLSHFSKTLKEKDGSPMVEMSRFQCNNCHVPQVDAKPLVDNAFVGVTK
jgi:cytochrome c-type protein NapB